MSGYKRWWVVGVVLACAALAWTGLHATRLVGGHLAGTACATCHLAGQNTQPSNARTLTASQEALCGRCHPDAVQVSHPTGFHPGRPLPAAYPVDWKGDLTCSSCHEIHSDYPKLMRGTLQGKAFCLACHDQKFFSTMRDQGTSMVQSGHMNLGMKSAQMRNLDPYSINCMGCHGQHGDADAVSIDSQMVLRHGTDGLNHPIGRNYAEARRFGGYRSQAMLSKKILLPNGRIGCISCHEGYAKEHGKLVIPKQRSALCMECHDI